MKVLLSAYACEPWRGSEPEVGFQALLAAASAHEVWVLTRANNLAPLRQALADSAWRERVHLVAVEVTGRAAGWKRRGLLGLHWYYDAWQREAAHAARALDRQIGFDVVHHVTFATCWTRAGVARLERPLVWGPVGGTVVAPLRLWGELGPRGIAEDLLRGCVRVVSAARPSVRRTARRAAVALAQNRDTARWLAGRAQRIEILPNATSILEAGLELPRVGSRTREIAMAGRLIPWKAGTLAIRVLRQLAHRDATLVFYGSGPERERIVRHARTAGVADRVRFAGALPRPELLECIASSAVLLHTALHEEAGLAIAESLALGTPVVALDHGGPAVLCSLWPERLSAVIRPDTPGRTARQLALAVDRFLGAPPPPSAQILHPSRSFRTQILRAYEVACAHELDAGLAHRSRAASARAAI
jgi:glycosyltransferase involved in cell wall biosynthesis